MSTMLIILTNRLFELIPRKGLFNLYKDRGVKLVKNLFLVELFQLPEVFPKFYTFTFQSLIGLKKMDKQHVI